MAELPESAGPKKPKAFPLSGTADIAGQVKAIEIIFLAPIGILARGKDLLVKVGSFYSISINLPGERLPVEARMRVFKTYDRAGAHIEHMAELQFDNLVSEDRNRISMFNKQFGQK